jgi:hypothetical protein
MDEALWGWSGGELTNGTTVSAIAMSRLKGKA